MIWKLLHWVGWVLFVPLIGLFFWSVILKKDLPARPLVLSEGRLRFPVDRVQLWLQNLTGVLMLIFAAEYLRHGFHVSLDCFTGCFFCLAGASFFIGTPQFIEMSDEGIAEVYRIGKNRFIRWEDIEEINIGKRDKLITIRSKRKTRIVYTSQPEHRARFLDEIKKHCGDELPAEFPGDVEGESESR